MHAFTQPGKLRAVDGEAFFPEQCIDMAKGPTAAQCAMNDYYSWLRRCVGLWSLSVGGVQRRRQQKSQAAICKSSPSNLHSDLAHACGGYQSQLWEPNEQSCERVS